MTIEPRPRLPQPRGPSAKPSSTRCEVRRVRFGSRASTASTCSMTTTRQLALTCCYELHYESFVGVDDRWEWAPELLELTNQLEPPSSSASSTRSARRRDRAPRRRARAPRARARRRTVALELPGGARQPRAHARVLRAPIRVPAQGSRPAHLDDPAAPRPGQGRGGHDPVRRVRRRCGRRDARRALRDDDGSARSRPDLRRVPRSPARRRRSRPATSSRCSGCTAAGGPPASVISRCSR